MKYVMIPALIALEHDNGLVESQVVKYNGQPWNLGRQLYEMNWKQLADLLPYTLHSVRNGEPYYAEFRSDMRPTSKVFESSDSYFHHWEKMLYGTIPYAYMLSHGGTWVMKDPDNGLQLLDIALDDMGYRV